MSSRPVGAVLILVLAALAMCGVAHAGAPPAQFAAWGSAGPEFAPPPAGWTQAPAPAAAPAAWSPTPEQR